VNRKLGLEEALDIAMEAELKAQAFYAQAAVEVQAPAGRDLLSRLAAFEQYHYQQLSELAQEWQENGRFISYKTMSVGDFAPMAKGGGEASGTLLEELGDEASILGVAIVNEKSAGERYRVLAEETDDPDGKDMFRKLANEEAIHQRILEDEFFSLSNNGTWGWSGMYGE
jgi:rubrerythrin